MNEKHYHADLAFFTWFDVVYRGLSLAVQDPVVVPNSEIGFKDLPFLSSMPVDVTQVYFYVRIENRRLYRLSHN